jgi:hypothetical protein
MKYGTHHKGQCESSYPPPRNPGHTTPFVEMDGVMTRKTRFSQEVREREFKKQRLRYFLPELDRWWRERV